MSRLLITLILSLLLLQTGYLRTAGAVDNSSIFSVDYGRLLYRDTMHTLTAPKRWGWEDWRDVSIYTAGVGTVLLLDNQIYEGIQRNRTGSTDDMAKFFEPFGSYPSFGIMGAFYSAGELLDDSRARRVAMDAFASSLVSAGIITSTLKAAAGRSRPRQGDGTYEFNPFGGNLSFPSGHTTQAFSLASVIAEHYDVLWVDMASYGIAALVGLARIEQEAHFPSDVLAGAIIGTVVGKTVVRYNRRYHRITFIPSFGSHPSPLPSPQGGEEFSCPFVCGAHEGSFMNEPGGLSLSGLNMRIEF